MTNNLTLVDWLLPYQKRFAEAPQKKKIFLSGRQLGKSFCLSYIAVKKALLKPNGLVLCISTGSRAADELLKKVKQFAEAVQVMTDGNITFEASADKVKFNTGARIISLPSGNPAGLRGYSSACTIIDEAAYIENSDEVFQAIAPTLTRDPNAELIVASTPAGCSGLFYELWCQADNDASWYKQTTTIEDAVNEGLKVNIDDLKKLCPDPEVFDIEYMCKFSQSIGSFIDPTAINFADSCPFTNATRHILGVDFGRKNDSTALVTLLQSQQGLYLDDIAILNNTDWQSQFTFIQTLNSKNHYIAGNMDANGIGSAIAEQVQKQINHFLVPFSTTGSNKTPMYEYLKGLIYEKKLIINSRFKDQILKDFANIRKIVADNGKVSYSAGHMSGHSDITSAIVLACQASKDHPISAARPLAYNRMSVFR